MHNKKRAQVFPELLLTAGWSKGGENDAPWASLSPAHAGLDDRLSHEIPFFFPPPLPLVQHLIYFTVTIIIRKTNSYASFDPVIMVGCLPTYLPSEHARPWLRSQSDRCKHLFWVRPCMGAVRGSWGTSKLPLFCVLIWKSLGKECDTQERAMINYP